MRQTARSSAEMRTVYNAHVKLPSFEHCVLMTRCDPSGKVKSGSIFKRPMAVPSSVSKGFAVRTTEVVVPIEALLNRDLHLHCERGAKLSQPCAALASLLCPGAVSDELFLDRVSRVSSFLVRWHPPYYTRIFEGDACPPVGLIFRVCFWFLVIVMPQFILIAT